MRTFINSTLIGLAVLFFSLACQNSEQHKEVPVKRDTEPQARFDKEAQEREKERHAKFEETRKREKEFEKKAQEREKWKLLTSRCTSLRGRIFSLPPMLREDMAFFLGEADSDLRAVHANFNNPKLAGVTSRLNPNFVEKMLEDAQWFLDNIEKCIDEAKGKQTCQLDEEASSVLRTTPGDTKADFLREVANFCPE